MIVKERTRPRHPDWSDSTCLCVSLPKQSSRTLLRDPPPPIWVAINTSACFLHPLNTRASATLRSFRSALQHERVGQYKKTQERGRGHIDYRENRTFSDKTTYESLQGTAALNPALVSARPEPVVTSYGSHPVPGDSAPPAGAAGSRGGPPPGTAVHHEPSQASWHNPGVDRHHGNRGRVGSPVKAGAANEFAYADNGITASIPTAGSFRGYGSNPNEGGRPTDYWQSQFEIDKGMGGDHRHEQKRTDPFTKAQQQKYGVSYHEKMKERPDVPKEALIEKPSRPRTSMNYKHDGPATAEEAGGSSGTAHWPAAGKAIGGNAPMYLYYASTGEHLKHGHGEGAATLETGRVIPTAGHHETRPSRDDGTEQMMKAKQVLADVGAIPQAGKEGRNYTPQHVRYASHWGIDHGHGDHMKETSATRESKWIEDVDGAHAPPLVNFVPDGHLHSGPAPEVGVQKAYPSAGIKVGGNQPQYLRYASSWDVSHGHGNTYESAAKGTHQYQHDPELHARGVVPQSQGSYMHPARTPTEHVQEAREKAQRAAELNRASAVRISHNHQNYDVRQQSSYSASHASSHVGHHQHVHTHASHATDRRKHDFRPHSAPGIPGSGY